MDRLDDAMLKHSTVRAIDQELKAASEKHEDAFVANLQMRSSVDMHMVHAMVSAGAMAKSLCEEGYPTQLAVLMEEVGEVAEAVMRGQDVAGELIQVAAMASMMAQQRMSEE